MNSGIMYPHVGMPLTCAIAYELIPQFFSGQTIELRQIVDRVTQSHIEQGGLKARSARADAPIGQALAKLTQIQLATKGSHGFWVILRQGDAPSSDQDSAISSQVVEDSKVEANSDIELGSGASAIYVYYFDNYRESAAQANRDRWPCKIGRTDRDPLTRVNSQVATSLPEHPHIALILRTSEPSWWESVLHGVLTIRGFAKTDSPGCEWFNTSPHEVLEIIGFICPDLLSGRSDSPHRDPVN